MIIRILTTILLFAILATPLAAEILVRSTTQLEQLPVQGITLSMVPKEAFETLLSAGFKAGDLRTYEDWKSDGVEFVRGRYGSPNGHSSVSFSRRGERIITISETFHSPGNPIDAQAAIKSVREQLSIQEDSNKCRATATHSGLCEVQDSDDPGQATILYKLQILSVMRLMTISRPKELSQH
ncbi:MAG: hypothetical protein PVI94_17510 [Desulfobacterales bacterium]|jgi:hypothetical protein